MKISYGSDVGMVRTDNQDSFYVKQYSDDCGLFIVADGMGGHRGGKTASSMAVDVISRYFEQNHDKLNDGQSVKKILITAVEAANKEIFLKSSDEEELNGMGTTIVAFVIYHNVLYTASVGDSRAYVFNDNRVFQITTDHSLVANLISKGIISPDEALTHPQKNVITRAVGTEDSVVIDLFETPLAKGNIIVACTDGLHSMISDSEIARVVNQSIENSADELISLANKRGGNDNITVIAVKIS